MTIAIPSLDRTTAAERGLTIADFLVPIALAERINTRVRAHRARRGRRAVHLLTARIYIVRVAGADDRADVRGAGRRRRARVPPRVRRASRCTSLLGLVGLPFFAEGKGGLAVLVGATGGYLVGFVLAGARRPAGRARLGSPHRRRARDDDRSAASSSTRSACRG